MEKTTITISRGRVTTSARTIFRRSIYTFLQNYHHLTSYAALIALPFSASILVSSSSSSSSLVHDRVEALFAAAGFPPSQPFSILSLKLSQTISSSLLTFPFALSFLLLAKASTLHTLHKTSPWPWPMPMSMPSLYTPLLHTYLCNSLLIISANATAFTLLCLASTLLQGPKTHLLLSSGGAVLYSIFLANALVVSNLSLVLAGVEGRGGLVAILKACVIIRGRTSTALALALPISLAMAGIEALFQFRVVRAHDHHRGFFASVEPLLIAFLYSVLVVLDTVVSYTFLNSCNKGSWADQESAAFLCYKIDQEMGYDSESEELVA